MALVLVLVLLPSALTAIELSDRCPPRFELTENGTCEFRSLYDFYGTEEDHGGVRARLPSLDKAFTPQQIDLGRYLFFDPILSVDKDLSCASCHQPDKGFADGRGRSLGKRLGAGGRLLLDRGAPTLWNAGFLSRLMADGRAATLEEQALLPLLSDKEMGNSIGQIEHSLSSNAEYARLFRDAFGGPPSIDRVASALSAFQSSLVSFSSRYDRYAHGDSEALSAEEIRGYNHFRGFVGRCSQCHIPPLFTDSELAVIGSPALPGHRPDPGAGAVSDDPFLMGAFRVPTLRNVTKTAPYFHAGQFANLHQVVNFYNNTRGHAAPPELDLRLHWHIHMTDGAKLTDQDERDIVAFLHALEDESTMPAIPDEVPSGLPVTFNIEE